MRLFFAVNFDQTTKDRLADIQSAMKICAVSANYTRRENLHLTLAFLGEVTNNRVAELEQMSAKLNTEPLTLEFADFGSFGGGLYYAQIRRTNELICLQSELVKNLLESGFKLEEQGFVPHVTLARKLKSDGRVNVSYEPFSMRTDRISLMKSEFIGGKIVYTEIFPVLLT